MSERNDAYENVCRDRERLIEALDAVTEALSEVLMSYGDGMPKQAFAERRRLVLDAQALLASLPSKAVRDAEMAGLVAECFEQAVADLHSELKATTDEMRVRGDAIDALLKQSRRS